MPPVDKATVAGGHDSAHHLAAWGQTWRFWSLHTRFHEWNCTRKVCFQSALDWCIVDAPQVVRVDIFCNGTGTFAFTTIIRRSFCWCYFTTSGHLRQIQGWHKCPYVSLYLLNISRSCPGVWLGNRKVPCFPGRWAQDLSESPKLTGASAETRNPTSNPVPWMTCGVADNGWHGIIKAEQHLSVSMLDNYIVQYELPRFQ